MINIIKCNGLDDLILQAYEYRKINKIAAKVFLINYKALRFEIIMNNDTEFYTTLGHVKYDKMAKDELYKIIRNASISIEDFINKQLMSFV